MAFKSKYTGPQVEEILDLIKVGGGSNALVNIYLTLDGATNTITKGATITITNNATGEEIVKTWEGDKIQVLIAGMTEYTIKCSKITGYTSPKKVVFISSKDVTYDYTFNYITPPVGVYLLTTDDELIAPADWRSSYDCVGVYVGLSSNIPNNKHSRVVLYPSFESCKAIYVNEKNFEDLRSGYYGGVWDNWNKIEHHGLEITRYLYENYTGSSYTSFAHSKAWLYTFKNGAQGWIPTWTDLMYFILPNFAKIKAAYQAIGVTIPIDAPTNDVYYKSIGLWSSTACWTNIDEDYGWQCGEEYYEDEDTWDEIVRNSSINKYYLLSFALY